MSFLANFISVRLTNRSSSGPSRPGVLTGRRPFTQTLDHSNPPFARWFCEGRTNLCHNAIDRWLEKQPEALALIAVSSETEEERTFTFRQLHDEVECGGVNAALTGRAAWRSGAGVYADDCRSAYYPAGLRAHWRYSFGGVWGFASHSVAARIDDAKPVLIVSADAGARGSKIIPYKNCSTMR